MTNQPVLLSDANQGEPVDLPTSIEDLLSPEERTKLYADLAELARCRRRAANEAAFIQMW